MQEAQGRWRLLRPELAVRFHVREGEVWGWNSCQGCPPTSLASLSLIPGDGAHGTEQQVLMGIYVEEVGGGGDEDEAEEDESAEEGGKQGRERR
eukprot:543268-Hanusia_phi.AAC.1